MEQQESDASAPPCGLMTMLQIRFQISSGLILVYFIFKFTFLVNFCLCPPRRRSYFRSTFPVFMGRWSDVMWLYTG